MSNQQQSHSSEVLHAKKKKASIIFSVVWLIPLIALLTGIWLLVSTLSETGPKIVLNTGSADGLVAGTTVIKILNVEVGRITDIRLNKSHNGVVLEAQMRAEVGDLLKTDTQFWVVKPRIDESGISGLGTLLSGAYLEMAPGNEESMSHEFNVLESPPVTSSSKSGIHLKLYGEINELIAVGSPILYRNVEIGKVESSFLNVKQKRVEYQIFISKPNQDLIGKSVHFWINKGININSVKGAFNITAPPVTALLSGAIVVGEPANGNKGEPVGENDVFTLYSNLGKVPEIASEKAQYFIAFFNQNIGSLNINSDVRYKGITIGKVAEIPYFINDDKMNILKNKYIPVKFYLDPYLLNPHAQEHDIKKWKESLDIALKAGLSIKIASENIITGSQYLQLSDSNPKEKLLLPQKTYNNIIVLGSKTGGLDQVQDQLNTLLSKFNQLPLDETVKKINSNLTILQNLLKQQDSQELTHEIRTTLQSLREVLNGVSPEAPLYQDLHQTLQRIDQTLNKTEPLLRNLNEKPNSLIFNGQGQDIIPKGKK